MTPCEARATSGRPMECPREATWSGSPLIPAVGGEVEVGRALHLGWYLRACALHHNQATPAAYFDADARAMVWAALQHSKPGARSLDWDRAVFLWTEIGGETVASRQKQYGTIDRCGAKPPAGFRETAVCLVKVGHEGDHQNGIDQIRWANEASS